VTDSSGNITALYKPYHLIGLELGVSVASVGLRHEPTGAPSAWRGDVAATAKRDLKAGEMLDGEGGYTVFGRLMPARDSLADKVDLLHGGADDFLPKPFELEELEARLLALVRRSRGREHPRFRCGHLQFDAGSQKFLLHGETFVLPPREHAVLRTLIQRSGEALSKQTILDRVLPGDTDVNLEAIEVAVHRVRKKLAELATSGVHIVTLRGLGYCLEPLADKPTGDTTSDPPRTPPTDPA